MLKTEIILTRLFLHRLQYFREQILRTNAPRWMAKDIQSFLANQSAHSALSAVLLPTNNHYSRKVDSSSVSLLPEAWKSLPLIYFCRNKTQRSKRNSWGPENHFICEKRKHMLTKERSNGNIVLGVHRRVAPVNRSAGSWKARLLRHHLCECFKCG